MNGYVETFFVSIFVKMPIELTQHKMHVTSIETDPSSRAFLNLGRSG